MKGLLLYRDYRNGRKDATGGFGSGFTGLFDTEERPFLERNYYYRSIRRRVAGTLAGTAAGRRRVALERRPNGVRQPSPPAGNRAPVHRRPSAKCPSPESGAAARSVRQ